MIYPFPTLLHEETRWIKNRLQTMRLMELLSRLSTVGRHAALYASLRRIRQRGWGQLASIDDPPKVLELYHHLQGVGQETQCRVVAAANQWFNHRASFFALHETPLGDSIEWHRDYSSGVTSPIRYSGLIKRHDEATVGNVRYIWELNRLQHFVLLALATTWTGNEIYIKEIERQLISWLAQNPFMQGINWKSPLEAGIRLISWAFMSFLLQDSNQIRGIFSRNFRETIYLHQYFIRKFYSKHSSANNHLIGELAGLYVGSVFWPWYPESRSWRSFARRKLIQEIDSQVETDGVGKERAVEYQLFILEFFFLVGALGHLIGDPFPQEYWECLNRMVGFLIAISDREGNLPMFGDSDSGQVVWLPEDTRERTHAFVRSSHCFDRPFEEGLNLRSMLLRWGQTPEQLPFAPPPRSGQNLQAFQQGGYYVLSMNRDRDSEMVVVFDIGPLGLPPLNAHGHADALSFWLSYGGREFLIDPGTFCYHTNPPWRAYFRGTAAHNTIRVDGEDQSAAGGPFLWRSAANCQMERMEEQEEFVEVVGFHDGYRRLTDPVIHRRSLRLYKKSPMIVINDCLECQGTHNVEVFFHLSEQCQVRQVGANSFQASNGNKHLSIHLDSQLQPALYRGSEYPISGWVSRLFDVKKASFSLVGRASVTGITRFLVKIVPT